MKSSPGLVRVHVGDTATLIWGTDNDNYGTRLHHTSDSEENTVAVWTFGSAHFTKAYRNRSYDLHQGTTWGFALNTTIESDALNYILFFEDGSEYHNATIYIYSESYHSIAAYLL